MREYAHSCARACPCGSASVCVCVCVCACVFLRARVVMCSRVFMYAYIYRLYLYMYIASLFTPPPPISPFSVLVPASIAEHQTHRACVGHAHMTRQVKRCGCTRYARRIRAKQTNHTSSSSKSSISSSSSSYSSSSSASPVNHLIAWGTRRSWNAMPIS